MDITMAADGNTAVALSCAPLCAPTQFLFDAVDDLSQMYLTDKWTGSIKFCCLPANSSMIGSPLDKSLIKEVDICDYLGYSSSIGYVVRLYLDPDKYDKPPLNGELVSKNLHWIELKVALERAAHTHGSPIM
jgi:hypothetical protein